MLSVFFSGYATTQILGGKLADQFGGKMVLAAGVARECVCIKSVGGGGIPKAQPDQFGGKMVGVARECVCVGRVRRGRSNTQEGVRSGTRQCWRRACIKRGRGNTQAGLFWG